MTRKVYEETLECYRSWRVAVRVSNGSLIHGELLPVKKGRDTDQFGVKPNVLYGGVVNFVDDGYRSEYRFTLESIRAIWCLWNTEG